MGGDRLELRDEHPEHDSSSVRHLRDRGDDLHLHGVLLHGRRRAHRKLPAKQDRAAVSGVDDVARGERARRVVRRDLLDVSHAGDQVLDHSRHEPSVSCPAGWCAGDPLVYHWVLPDRRLVERVPAGRLLAGDLS